MKITERKVILSYEFTLGPGDPDPEEMAMLAQLRAIAEHMNGKALPKGQGDVLSVVSAPPGPRNHARRLRVMPWHCGNCPAVGETYKRSADHERCHPLHAIVFEN